MMLAMIENLFVGCFIRVIFFFYSNLICISGYIVVQIAANAVQRAETAEATQKSMEVSVWRRSLCLSLCSVAIDIAALQVFSPSSPVIVASLIYCRS